MPGETAGRPARPDVASKQPQDRLWTMEELAAYCRVPLATCRKWRAEGKGPAGFRLGKRVLYRESTIMAWIGKQEDLEWL